MSKSASPGLELIGQVRRHRIVAIIRGRDPEAVVRAGMTLVEAGINLLEVSLTSQDALHSIERLAVELTGSDAVLGAGTLTASGDAERCLNAGATFAVTPALGPGLTESVEVGLPVLAGALTPTEVLAAHRAGASGVKVFPASAFGPSYFRSLSGPFPDIPLLAVGGISDTDVAAFLRAGAVGVGVGSPLVGDAADGGDLGGLTVRAKRFRDAVYLD